MKYYQCNLSQGSGRTQAYIEERGAIAGARVELKGVEGLWVVDQVSDIGIDEDRLREKQSMNRNAHPSLV